jgi:hypothetical protein
MTVSNATTASRKIQPPNTATVVQDTIAMQQLLPVPA